jgi:hypothetical protein
MFRGILAAALALFLAPASAAAADAPSPAQSLATLDVTFEVTGGGTTTSPDKSLKRDWQVKDVYEVRAEMTAQAPSGFPSLHEQDAAQQKTEAERAAAADRAATNMAPMMASAEKIMEKCGDDEDCITRESMKMAQGIDPDSAEMKSAREDVGTVSKMPDARYQTFMPTVQSGSFTVRESMKVADRDPICIGKPQDTCHTSVEVQGAGDITLDGQKKAGGSTTAEIDLAKNTLRFTIPLPYPVVASETTKTDNPDLTNGTRDTHRFLTNLKLDLAVAHGCGASCRTARGEKTYDIVDQLSGQPARLKVTWAFSRK